MLSLELKNILIMSIDDNNREIKRAAKELEDIDKEFDVLEYDSLVSEIRDRESIRDNAIFMLNQDKAE